MANQNLVLFSSSNGDVSSLNMPGLGLAPNTLFIESFQDNIVAGTTQTQAGATALTAEVNRVTTSATSGNGVRLPASQAGVTIVVINHGNNPIQVYGNGSDTVSDVAGATGVTQMQGSVALYMCATAGAWYVEGLGTGYAGNFPTFSYQDAMSGAGANQATATPIKTCQNRFTTVGSGTGAVLPVAAGGMSIVVMNAGANSLQVYGNGSDTINGVAGATGVALAAGKTAEYFTTVAGAWHQLLSA